MDKIVKMISLLLFLAFFCSFTIVSNNSKDDKKKYLSIEEAIKNKVVSARLRGKGGYQGECVEISIESLIDKDTIIRIEAGRQLVADDTLFQDILIIKEIKLLLAAKEKKILNIFGFCCKATKRSPDAGAKFSVGFMPDSSFIKLAMFLSASNLPLDVMQNAVWVLSNNHSINSISNENENDKPKMKELYKLIAGVKGLEMKFPWYTLKYKIDTAQLFSNRPIKLLGEFEYSLSDPAHVDLIIRNSRNKLITKLFANRPQNPDNYNYRFTLDVANLPKGKYFVILFVDNQLRLKREFEL